MKLACFRSELVNESQCGSLEVAQEKYFLLKCLAKKAILNKAFISLLPTGSVSMFCANPRCYESNTPAQVSREASVSARINLAPIKNPS